MTSYYMSQTSVSCFVNDQNTMNVKSTDAKSAHCNPQKEEAVHLEITQSI